MIKQISNGVISVEVKGSVAEIFKALKELGADIGLSSLKEVVAGRKEEAKGFKIIEVADESEVKVRKPRKVFHYKVADDMDVASLKDGRVKQMLEAIQQGHDSVNKLKEALQDINADWFQHGLKIAKFKKQIVEIGCY